MRSDDRPLTYDWNGHTDMAITFAWLSDVEMAGKVRMLMRHDLEHEAVVVGARDRIMALSKALEQCEVDRQERIQQCDRMAKDWTDFCAAVGATWDTQDAVAEELMANQEKLASDSGRGWRDLADAPRDGTIIEVVGRYVTATTGFPRYVGFHDGRWLEYSRHAPEEIIPLVWRPRTDFPQFSDPDQDRRPPRLYLVED